jgi:hypothetical protein
MDHGKIMHGVLISDWLLIATAMVVTCRDNDVDSDKHDDW